MIPTYYVFLFPVLAFGLYLDEFPISLNLVYLCIPLSVYLAYRYRWQGVILTAVAGLLLPIGIKPTSDFGGFYPALHVYITAILAAWLVVRKGLPYKFKKWVTSPFVFGLALVIMPLSSPYFPLAISDDLTITIRISLYFVLYFLIFLQGLTGVNPRLVIGGLLLATLAGFFIDIFGLPLSFEYASSHDLPDHLQYRYYFNNPDSVLVGLIYYIAGRHYGSLLKYGPKPQCVNWRTWLIVILMIAIWLAKLAFIPIFDYPVRFGSFAVLPVACLFLGMLWQARGVALAVLVATTSVLIASLLRSHFSLDEPLYAIGFGLMGVKMYELATGEKVGWSSTWIYSAAWLPAVAFLIAGVVELIIESENLMELQPACIALITMVILVIASIMAVRELLAWAENLKIGRVVKRWSGIVVVCVMLYTLIADIHGLGSQFVKAIDTVISLISAKTHRLLLPQETSAYFGRMNFQILFTVLSALGAILLFVTIILRQFITYDKIIDDLREILRRTAVIISNIFGKSWQGVATAFTALADRIEKGSWGFSPATLRILKISQVTLEQVRNLVVAVALIYMLLIF